MNNPTVSIFSLNTRGLADKRKRAEVFSWLKDQDADIFYLQETHSTPNTKRSWIDQWGLSSLIFPMVHRTVEGHVLCFAT